MRLRIKELMQEKGEREGVRITQAAVADELKINRSRFGQYANNFIQRIDVDMLEKLCDYFEVEPGVLIVREQTKKAS